VFDGNPGNGETNAPSPEASKPMNGLFTALVTEIEIEVDYQSGAEPYTGSVLLFGRLWDTFQTNVEAIFSAHPKTLYLDDELAEMERLSDVSGTDFDVGKILDIADRHRQSADTATRRSFYFLFLDGYFKDQTGRRPNVLGVSIGKTGVIAMFKPVIDSTGSSRKRIEQTTMVHELGHAIGLVDNGVPALDDTHRDDPHGAHCTNDECIMYWLNESGSDLAGFVTRNLLSSNTVLFDQDCLNDLDRASR
jgi:predicted Zn-dependent protease